MVAGLGPTYAFCSPSLISYIESLNIDEMKCETPSTILKRGERPSDHCAMTMKMNVPNRQHISKEKSNTMWNFQDKKGWEKFRTLTETDKNLTSVWEKSDSGITDTYGKWSCYLNKILHICFRKRRVRNKPRLYNREIRGLLKDKQNLKKDVSLLPEGREKLVLLEQLNKLSKRIKCKIGVFHFNLMSRNLDKNGKMSQQNFWKVKKKLFPRLNVPHAVIDNYGNEVTDPFNIKTLYQSEFECRLRRRNIKAKLKEHESAVNELCNTRLENARCNTSSNYQVEEVQTAIKELRLGKSVDPTGLIREVSIRGGSGLVHSITAMFNVFLKKF